MIYFNWCENERKLASDIKQLNLMINRAIKTDKDSEIGVLTNMIALVYSAYVEVSFYKMINTPYGLSKEYIEQIMKKPNIEEKWLKCLELSFRAVQGKDIKGTLANQRQKLTRILQEYIVEPSKIRNKIAHGQWAIAFNNKATAANFDTTQKVEELDPIAVLKYYEIYRMFAQCIEDLIESPNKAHYNNYYKHMVKLEKYIDDSKGWTLETKKALLKEKHNRYKNSESKEKNCF